MNKKSKIIQRNEDSSERKFNKLLTFEERLNILHLHCSHNMNPRKIGLHLGMKSSTVRAIVLAYEKHGRLNKLLTYSAKLQLLNLKKRKQKKLIGF